MLRSVNYAAALLLVSAFCVSSVQAQEMDDEDYIKSRVAHYREIGTWFKSINDEMKDKAPKLSTIKLAAVSINRLAKQQYNWFRPGSGPESEEKTRAKPLIWQKPAEFKAEQDKFLAASNAFLTAANSATDGKALAPQFKALGQTCAGCHNTYRSE